MLFCSNKRKFNLIAILAVNVSAFSISAAFAQMMTCTTEDGITFNTTSPTGYNLAIKNCKPAIDSSSNSMALDASNGQYTSEPNYSDSLQVYGSAQPTLIVPVAPRRHHKTPETTIEATPGEISWRSGSLPYQDIMNDVGYAHKIDPLFLQAIARAESGHNRFALSPVGAKGLMQLMPSTARRYAQFSNNSVLNDPLTNVSISAAYLKSLQSRYGNNLPLVLAAYNAGEGAVAKYGNTIPPYKETRKYVVKVLNYYNTYRSKQ